MAQTSAKLDGQYVLGIAQSSAHYAVHTSSPASAIYLLDKTTLARTTTRSAHAGHGTTALKTADLAGSGAHTLISAGKDGTVVVWDERTAQPAITRASPTRNTLSHAFDGSKVSHSSASAGVLSIDALPTRNLIAAGTALQGDDASILYWYARASARPFATHVQTGRAYRDPRAPGAPTHTHASTHSDDITVLSFRETSDGPLLLSASSDGLVCTSNPLEQDEDEAALNVANFGSSIAHAGWSASGHVWASSDMETAAIWNCEVRKS